MTRGLNGTASAHADVVAWWSELQEFIVPPCVCLDGGFGWYREFGLDGFLGWQFFYEDIFTFIISDNKAWPYIHIGSADFFLLLPSSS